MTSIQNPKSNIQHPVSSIQYPASSIQHPPSSIQHPASRNQLRLVAWELTRRCNLNCVHCRAGSERGPYPGELSTTKCLEILGQIREVGEPIVILTGGEPLLREDIFRTCAEGNRVGSPHGHGHERDSLDS